MTCDRSVVSPGTYDVLMIQMLLNSIDSSLCLLQFSLNIDEQIRICVNVCFPPHLVRHAGLLCGGDFKLLCL